MENSPLRPPAKSVERVLITGLILFGWALIAVLRLIDLQVFAHDKYVRAAEAQQDKRRVIEAVRGPVLDRNGNYLAISSPSLIAVVNPLRITNLEAAAGLLGSVLKLDARKLQDDLEAALKSKHPGYLVVDTHVTTEKAAALHELNLEWLDVRQGSVRSYPDGQLAAHVVGNVGGDGRGAAGVEGRFNKDLAGQPGWESIKVDVRGRAYESEVAVSPANGKTVALTIDSDIQHVAEEALKESVIKNHGDHGSLVAMDPNTGEVLALANYPTYDLNERLHAGEKAHGRENLAVGSPFEPGSVFKVVTLSAALETTNLTPETMINCGGGVTTLFGRVIHDSHPYGSLSMQDVLAKSSNIGAIHIGQVVGNKNLYEYIRRFGFGSRTGIELPAEARGMLRPLKRWQPTSIGSIPMGHELSVTSLQLAQLGSVIANGGFLVHPHVIAWKQAPGGPKEYTHPPTPQPVLKPETVMTMRMMMRRVVSPIGTARHLHVIGYSLAGKTGTAQIYDFTHRIYTHRYNASFMGFAPSNNPKLVIVVTISGTTGEAGFGGAAAGPVFQSVMATAMRRLSIPRDVPEEVEELLAKDQEAKQKDKAGPEIDDTSLASLDPPTEEEMRDATANSDNDVSAVAADPNAPKVPNFVGKTVKDVMQEAASEGVDVRLWGDGLSRAQSPAPGALLSPGEIIQVRFAH